VLSNDPAHGRAIVSRIRSNCEHPDALTDGCELVAVDGAAVPAPLKNSDFDALLTKIKAAKRPFDLVFARPAALRHAPARRASAALARATPASTPRADAPPSAVVEPTDAELSWNDFIRAQAQAQGAAD